jgi:hypothetical protein
MNIDLEVLKQITATAVKAEGIRDYQISPLLKRHVRSDGTSIDIDLAPPPQKNTLCDLEACVAQYKRCKLEGAEIFVGSDSIQVMHDGTRTEGKSDCSLECSEAITVIKQEAGENHTPEEFEKMAKLYFGADSHFINRIRKLQWQEKTDRTTTLSSVSKSADIQAIAKVVDENEILFQDISLLVRTPYFILPYRTSEVEIELHVIACAATKTISFAPAPGVMMLAAHAAAKEVLDAVNEMIGEDVAIFGVPVM